MSQLHAAQFNLSEAVGNVTNLGVRDIISMFHQNPLDIEARDTFDLYHAFDQQGMRPHDQERAIGAVERMDNILGNVSLIGRRKMWAPEHLVVLGESQSETTVRGIGIVAATETVVVSFSSEDEPKPRKLELGPSQILVFAGVGEIALPTSAKKNPKAKSGNGSQALVISGRTARV